MSDHPTTTYWIIEGLVLYNGHSPRMVDSEMPLSFGGQFGFPASYDNKIYCLECGVTAYPIDGDKEDTIMIDMGDTGDTDDGQRTVYKRRMKCGECKQEGVIVSRATEEGIGVDRT